MTRNLPWQKPNPVKNYYPVPKVICQLGLSPGEIAVYSFLLFCEDRKTYQCYPSYRTIGDAVGMSRNTVCKYVRSLEEKGLVRTERTTVTLKDGRKRNGSLLYTLLPVEQALAQHNQHQLHLAEMAAERHRAQQKLAAQNTLIPSAYCNQFSGDTGIMHKVLSAQTTDGLKFVVKYDSSTKMWKPAEEVKQMAIWVTCDKHETPTPEMPMYGDPVCH